MLRRDAHLVVVGGDPDVSCTTAGDRSSATTHRGPARLDRGRQYDRRRTASGVGCARIRRGVDEPLDECDVAVTCQGGQRFIERELALLVADLGELRADGVGPCFLRQGYARRAAIGCATPRCRARCRELRASQCNSVSELVGPLLVEERLEAAQRAAQAAGRHPHLVHRVVEAAPNCDVVAHENAGCSHATSPRPDR